MRLPSLLLAILGLVAARAEPARARWHFDLGTLPSTEVYNAARGYGFDLDTQPTTDRRPFYFSVNVPEGNYRVTVTLGDAKAAGNTTVKAESRRLMLEAVTTRPGETVTRSFIVNVRTTALTPPPPNAPGGTNVILNDREEGSLTWDRKLTLEFSGPAPCVGRVEVEPVEVPTVFLAGDSTVTDQRGEPGASWGQMLTRFLGPGVAVANHAESGETLKSFLTGLRLAKVLSQLKAGDYLFIQFGHNDEKTAWPQTYAEAHTTYLAYLRAYVAEARLRGATPVLVTSVQRRTFDAAGKIRNTHGDYPQVVRELAAAEHLALIDLDRASTVLYETLGPARSALAFSDGGHDITHHDNYGAYELAKCVVQGIRDARLPLASEIVPEFAGFDPAHPDAPETFQLAASPVRNQAPLRGN
ncbi:MAG TPA: rhamnogalacturonan acetylesterase [Opitutaceae bacterium]|nr:rhamnogalacturonan acetylesterase [Opitutaceae bacterium]